MLIVKEALRVGGFSSKTQFRQVQNNFDDLIDKIIQGRISLFCQTQFIGEVAPLKNDIHISDAVVDANTFYVGLYVSEDNLKALDFSEAGLSSLRAISNSSWRHEWQVLSGLDLALLQHSPNYNYMVKSVIKQQSDFMLRSFKGTEDMSVYRLGGRMVPIPGVKILLPESRHFAVSKRHPDGDALILALNKGIKILKDNGFIHRIYSKAGVYDPRVEDWLVIGRSSVEAVR